MAYLSVISANEMNAASCTTMFKDADDIDAIWKSLKSEGGSSSAGVGISTNFDAKKPKAKMKHKKVFAIQGNDQKFDIDSFSFEESASKSDSIQNNDRDQPQSSIKSCVDILGDLNVTKQFEPVLGDSDDEDDAKENTLILQNSNELFRVERLASALVSSDVKTRVSSLCMLKETMDALLMHCPMPPQLNFSSPYDENKIKLNTNLPLVSDLANSTHSDCDDLHVEPDNKVKNEEMIDFVDTKSQLQAILEACGSPLFRLIGDKHEKCRCLSLECIQSLLLVGLDIGKHIPYLIPAIVARYPPCTYDKDMEVFVQNSQMHDFYKRGGATDRQDRDGLINQNGSFQVIESNEELRLSLCRAFSCIVRGILGRDAGIVLDAYYSEILLALQTSLKDPFPEVKIEVSALLVQLLRVPRWEQAAKYFATGLARTSILNCRHRNTRVVIAAIDLFEASVCVPDKAKVKGSGTSAIADLVGFREENVSTCRRFHCS